MNFTENLPANPNGSTYLLIYSTVVLWIGGSFQICILSPIVRLRARNIGQFAHYSMHFR